MHAQLEHFSQETISRAFDTHISWVISSRRAMGLRSMPRRSTAWLPSCRGPLVHLKEVALQCHLLHMCLQDMCHLQEVCMCHLQEVCHLLFFHLQLQCQLPLQVQLCQLPQKCRPGTSLRMHLLAQVQCSIYEFAGSAMPELTGDLAYASTSGAG